MIFNQVRNNLITVLCLALLAGCLLFAHPQQSYAASDPEFTEFDQLNGKTVAMLTGAPYKELISSHAPHVKKFQYFDNVADMLMALKEGKIDAYMTSNAVALLATNRDDQIAMFPEPLVETEYGFAFKKGSKKEEEKWANALQQIPKATIQSLWDEWTGADEKVKEIPEQTWPGRNGTVHIATCDAIPPMSYRGDNNEIIGFDIELLLLMAQKLDVHLVFEGMPFDSVMPAVQSGKDLMGNGGIIITDERKKAVDFVPYYPASFVLVVRAAEDGKGVGFWAGMKASFYRTFIKDNRYRMVLSGLGLTVLIAVLSGLIGLLLAFWLVLLRQRNYGVVNRLIAFYESLIAGIPAVVILMVLYYVVFGKVQISAVIVAIIGFILIFGARAYGVIRTAIGAVDPGQWEAALALGFSERQAFRQIILPQSIPICMPVLQSQFVTLLKETSVAGFITVLELTRAGDLIRSATMEAFFPLISIAVIYYILTRLMTRLVGLIDVGLDRQHRARKIKGVDV